MNKKYNDKYLSEIFMTIYDINPKYTETKEGIDSITKDMYSFFEDSHNAKLLEENYTEYVEYRDKIKNIKNLNWDKNK